MKRMKLFSILLTLWLTAPRIFAQFACNVQNSLALIDFYESTNGSDWTNNSGWKQAPSTPWIYRILTATCKAVQLLSHTPSRLTILNLYENGVSDIKNFKTILIISKYIFNFKYQHDLV